MTKAKAKVAKPAAKKTAAKTAAKAPRVESAATATNAAAHNAIKLLAIAVAGLSGLTSEEQKLVDAAVAAAKEL
jgi:hypothetical protein